MCVCLLQNTTNNLDLDDRSKLEALLYLCTRLSAWQLTPSNKGILFTVEKQSGIRLSIDSLCKPLDVGHDTLATWRSTTTLSVRTQVFYYSLFSPSQCQNSVCCMRIATFTVEKVLSIYRADSMNLFAQCDKSNNWRFKKVPFSTKKLATLL